MLMVSLLFAGCQSSRPANSVARRLASGITLEAVDINDSLLPTNVEGSLAISGARNEWISFAVRVGHLPAASSLPESAVESGAFDRGREFFGI